LSADYGLALTPSAPLLAPNSFTSWCCPTSNEPSGSASYSQSRTFAELLIDAEEDKALRAVLVGMLRESS
jgi:hypothetical protein